MIIKSSLKSLFTVLFLVSCAAQPPVSEMPEATSSDSESVSEADRLPADGLPDDELAVVSAVKVSGEPGDYTFAVTIKSPDTGCNQYANWWEVLTEDGTLLYRRILAHSHSDEQPFTRSGGPVAVDAGQPVIVRVHMFPQGYSAQAVQGTAGEELVPATLPAGFASELAAVEPQPSGCAF